MSKTTERVAPVRTVDSPILATEIARALDIGLEELRSLAGKQVHEDALGRQWIDAPAVQRLRESLDKQRRQDIEDAGGFVTYLNARSAARQKTYQEAYASGHAKSHQRDTEIARKLNSGEIPSDYAIYRTGGIVNPQSRVRGSEAAVMAMRAFDSKHPEPSSVGHWIEMGRPKWKERRSR